MRALSDASWWFQLNSWNMSPDQSSGIYYPQSLIKAPNLVIDLRISLIKSLDKFLLYVWKEIFITMELFGGQLSIIGQYLSHRQNEDLAGACV
jgi:hypothetical protein